MGTSRSIRPVAGVRVMAGARVLGLDLGTSSLKALLLSADGRVEHSASAPYPTQRPASGCAEQHPDDWWRALHTCLSQLRLAGAPLADIGAIGLSGQMHGLVLLDRSTNPLGSCLTWADARSAMPEIERRVAPERIQAITGSRPYASATAGKLLWMRAHEPEKWRAAAHILLPKDELRRRLTGALATDPTDASGTQLFNVSARVWSLEMLDAVELDRGLLPPVLESTAAAGTLSRAAARELALPEGIPVVTGGGDTECAALGAGLDGSMEQRGTALISLGTAAQLFMVMDTPRVDVGGRLQTLCHVIPGHWHVMHALLTGASALDWLARTTTAPHDTPPRVETLLDEAGQAPPGANGLLFLPHLNGTRAPHADTAPQSGFIGLRPGHTRADLTRAVVEGIALALSEGIAAVRALGLPLQRIRLGGGGARHWLWARTVADVFDMPVERRAVNDASALGAAILAALGTGARDVAANALTAGNLAGETMQPVGENTELYASRARLSTRLSEELLPVFRQLASDM